MKVHGAYLRLSRIEVGLSLRVETQVNTCGRISLFFSVESRWFTASAVVEICHISLVLCL